MRKKDSVYLNVYDDEFKPVNKRGWLRRWKQLSRLQRNLISIMSISFIIIMVYVWPIHTHAAVIVPVAHNQTPHAIKNVMDEPNIVIDPSQNKPDTYQINRPESVKNKPVVFKGPSNPRQQAVVNAFKHAWSAYKRHAWGHDHVRPIMGAYSDWFGVGLSILDSLDTMYIMNLTQEFREARNWVDKSLNFDINKDVNLFEITIRVLGGLLSAYHFTKDPLFLDRAKDLGERLLPAFESQSGIPFSDVNLFTRQAHAPRWSPDSSTSEVTTIQLEFIDLSRCTGDQRFQEVVTKVSRHVHDMPKTNGLVPIFINPISGDFRSYSTITLGARGDSYYEYLLKQWLQTGKHNQDLINDYTEAIAGVEKLLVRRTSPNNLLFIGELIGGITSDKFKPKMDHLTCYLPGTLALGHANGLPKSHMTLALDLLNTCYETYARQPTFLAPEITYFNVQEASDNPGPDLYVKSSDAHNLLRPEFVESLWYMYQLTNDSKYQTWGWQIFEALERYCKVPGGGYTSIGNVKNKLDVKPKDMMESFFLSETLKYLYLLFGDNPKELDVTEWVVNSEAHPLPIYEA